MDTLEEELISNLDIKRMMENLKILVKKPRLSGTQEELEGFQYVQKKVTEYGVDNKLLTFRGYLSYPRFAKVEVGGDEPLTLQAKTRSFSASTSNDGVEGDVVYIPGGSDMFTDTKTIEMLRKTDLKDKIVLTEGGGRQNMIFAQKKGAIGYIHMWPNQDPLVHDSTVSPVWGTPTPEKINLIPNIPVVAITNMDGQLLLDRMKKGALKVRLFTTTETGWQDQRILECKIPGKSKQFVMIGSHLDTWDIGATDNLTGCCLAMELLRVFKLYQDKMEKGLRVCFWCGHSPGRFTGSTWYCDNNWVDLRKNCVMYQNIDMPGCSGRTTYNVFEATAETADIGIQVFKEITGKKVTWKRPGRYADMSFWGVGLPDLLVTGPSAIPDKGGSPWYWHTCQDLYDKADPDILLNDTKLYTLCAARVIFAKLLPLSITHAVQDLSQYVEELKPFAANCFDLDPIIKALDELNKSAVVFDDKRNDTYSEVQIELKNRKLSEALKELCTINYTNIGEFEHDPAAPRTPFMLMQEVKELNKLNGDAGGFLKTKLVRNRNMVVWHILEANRLIKEANSNV